MDLRNLCVCVLFAKPSKDPILRLYERRALYLASKSSQMASF